VRERENKRKMRGERRNSDRNEWCGGKSRVVLMAGRQPTNVYCLCILTIFALSHLSTLHHVIPLIY